MNLKKYFIKGVTTPIIISVEYKNTIYTKEYNNEKLCLIYGLAAFVLIFQGATNIEKNTLFSLYQIFLAFFVALPVSYLNRLSIEGKLNI